MPAPERTRIFGTSTELNSLFGEILDWMLAPLLFLWPISIAYTHHLANQLANQPYDQALADNVSVMARLVKITDGKVVVNFPAPARALLRADEHDITYYQVAVSGGEIITGDPEVPRADVPLQAEPDKVLFRDAEVNGEDVRVAYQFLSFPEARAPVLVQVAETRRKRENLAGRIISGVILPQFAIIPLAVILVYLGLSRGIAPLNRLQRRIRRRRPGDLAPINSNGIPEEIRPVIIAFNDLMARLEQNLQAQQRFIADAAHQMRTPLTGLKTQTELALSEVDPNLMHTSLEQIAESADRAAHLISQLLALARAEASHEKVHVFETVDLDVLARTVAQEWVPHALAKDIDLGFEGTGWPLLIEGSPVLLKELLGNLIDNAIKYTPRGGSVTVRTRARQHAILEVEDSGIGIREEERERVFERFYRVLGSDAHGSGLGLPIVREIAELHRARIRLRPNPKGHGTIAVAIFLRQEVPAPRLTAASSPA